MKEFIYCWRSRKIKSFISLMRKNECVLCIFIFHVTTKLDAKDHKRHIARWLFHCTHIFFARCSFSSPFHCKNVHAFCFVYIWINVNCFCTFYYHMKYDCNESHILMIYYKSNNFIVFFFIFLKQTKD